MDLGKQSRQTHNALQPPVRPARRQKKYASVRNYLHSFYRIPTHSHVFFTQKPNSLIKLYTYTEDNYIKLDKSTAITPLEINLEVF